MGDVRYLPGHEPESLRLRFGLNDVWPEEAVAVWGCRLIVKQDGYVDFVPDRQDAAGPDAPRKLLLELLMRRFGPGRMKDTVAWLLRLGYRGGMSTVDREWFVLYMDAEPVVCPSCGWFGEHRSGPIQGATCPRCGKRPVVRAERLTVVANTNASAGYCYVTAWLVPGGGE